MITIFLIRWFGPRKVGTDAQVMQLAARTRYRAYLDSAAIHAYFCGNSPNQRHSKCRKLLAYFISSLDNENLEGFYAVKTFKNLTEACGVSGNEDEVRNLLHDAIAPMSMKFK